ncbi:molybdopterin-dependent oxidoreductase [Pseudohalocynthiibacter aestuariivivens]|jgi:anaerobic selenocysteine-containing dehydrogenase|uniref:Molybdopterin-dependent oxidoreductase n=1 Tax=Pseudohalocynthiibacter aestuariivivens TaxID=1591409 RepID=A0ABV5JAB0_9RHOB|nr:MULTISPECIES: molybdopterin-dependent oxidoreductase [Pseudohalocynthiibacter]MBS9716048.1 molybdopterin-dependent oxidoreductase [Pseudohalocynthiibacter aestuariivivens]MCK0102394.1 molybdopterin-dependent oxidoreductase [Pseudohalocynthiibacter sp. F2068]
MNQHVGKQTLPSVCPLDCPDTCSLSAFVQDGKLVDVKGSHANPYTDGVICNKVARYYPEFVHGKNRLTHPLRRTGPRGSGTYTRITWEEALDLVSEGFSKAIKTHGPQSVMPFNYAGPHGELAGGSMDRRFFHKMGATLLNRGPLCGAVRGTAYTSLFGAAPGMPPEQAVHSDLIIVWGNNVTVSNLHLMRVLKDARAKGAKLVIVDPKRIKVAEQCDLFVQIHPGTDVILAMALAAELERRDALDMAFIENWTVGFEPFMAQARRYSVDDVVSECGIPEAQFLEIADLFESSNNIAASFGNGIERGRSGGSGLRAAMALQALTGNHGRLGAGVIAKSGLSAPKTQARLHSNDLIPNGTRTFNIVDVAEKLLDKTLDPPVMATMIYNHNPVATHPDQVNLIKALMRDDLFIVGSDIVMTDSMAFADVILPAASHFEYDDIYGAYGQNYVQRAAPVIPCVGESLPNTEIFRRLAARCGYDGAIFTASDEQLMDDAMDGADPRFNDVQPSQIAMDSSLEMNGPDGHELIMCKTVIPATKSGKIELFSDDLQTRFGYGVPRYEPVPQDQPLTLITPSSSKRTNATFGGCEASDCIEIVEMNPTDAEARGLVDADKVTVWNDRAEVTLRLVVTDATRKGVLYSPKGTWLNTSDTGLTANALIPSDIRTDIEDGACYNETFVDVRKSYKIGQP